MDSHDWTVLGLGIDMLGALLLSAEAIGLENLKRLRDKLSGWIDDLGSGFMVFRVFSPRRWRSGENFRAGPWLALLSVPLFFLFHMSIASAWIQVFIAIDPEVRAELDKDFDQFFFIWLPASPGWIVFVVVGWLVTAPVWLAIGQVVLMNGLLGIPVAILSFIDRHTDDGMIGVFGVTLLVLGFAFQAVGA